MLAMSNFLWLLGGESRQGPSKQLYLFNTKTRVWVNTEADKQATAPEVGFQGHSMAQVMLLCSKKKCLSFMVY
jgi:hypothetical protein